MSFINHDPDTLCVLIATDNHLGFKEKDSITGQDSFRTFEEILKIANDNQVDLVLLGGDLFHDAEPSRDCFTKTINLLRRYSLGERAPTVRIASDQSVNFEGEFKIANYYDANLNVGCPVFSIHGNHDRPTGLLDRSALDLLAASGLLNYFGRCIDLENPVISPILLQKGETKLALYGLGNIKDQKLLERWQSDNVTFSRPVEAEPNGWSSAFNMFVLHQNRARHNPTNCLPEEYIDSFFDLILWGHEHECRLQPEHFPSFEVTQPGSSVATSLSMSEAVPKHIGILNIKKGSYSLQQIPLKSVRPFEFLQIELSSVPNLKKTDQEACERYLADQVKMMIQKAKDTWDQSHSEEEEMLLPLIRLRVDYSGGFSAFNVQHFGTLFEKQVANPRDIILLHRTRDKVIRKKTTTTSVPEPVQEHQTKLFKDYFKENLGDDLPLVSGPSIVEFVEIAYKSEDPNIVHGHYKRLLEEALKNICAPPGVIRTPDEIMEVLHKAEKIDINKF